MKERTRHLVAKMTHIKRQKGKNMIVNIANAILTGALVHMLNLTPTIPDRNIAPEEKHIQISEEELNCLALNVYYESRGQDIVGQAAVAWVTINRANDERFPDDICEVVWQKGQFSWTKKRKKATTPKEHNDWKVAKNVANIVTVAYNNGINTDPTNGAIMFHSTKVRPSWNKSFEKTIKIDGHIFYK